MAVRATEIRKGQVIERDGDLWLVTDYEHKTPGNLRAIINIKIKSLSSGQTMPVRLGSADMLEVAYLERRKAEYLYKESNGDYVFMDNESFDQFSLSPDFVGDKMSYVRENTVVEITKHGETPVGVELPPVVTLKIIESENAVKGNTATNVKKVAKLETGIEIKVPLHIGVGEVVKVSTETGEFMGRAN
jgi:elongation factor P